MSRPPTKTQLAPLRAMAEEPLVLNRGLYHHAGNSDWGYFTPAEIEELSLNGWCKVTISNRRPKATITLRGRGELRKAGIAIAETAGAGALAALAGAK